MYSSATGNTRLLAEAIKASLPDQECIYYGDVCDMDADLYFIGFWCDKGDACLPVKNYLSTLHHKKIVLFGTCGFGGSNEYFSQIKQRVKTNINNDNEVISCFITQGKMGQSVLKRYEAMKANDPNNSVIDMMINNFHIAKNRPNENDLQYIREWCRDIYEKAKKNPN